MASTRHHPRRLRSAATAAAASSFSSSALPPAGWGVYILSCADGTLYTGCTSDLERRLRAHGGRQVKYTRGRLPVALAYWEAAGDRSTALRREAALKRLSRGAKLALCECAKLC